jgi:hypothetical protein
MAKSRQSELEDAINIQLLQLSGCEGLLERRMLFSLNRRFGSEAHGVLVSRIDTVTEIRKGLQAYIGAHRKALSAIRRPGQNRGGARASRKSSG